MITNGESTVGNTRPSSTTGSEVFSKYERTKKWNRKSCVSSLWEGWHFTTGSPTEEMMENISVKDINSIRKKRKYRLQKPINDYIRIKIFRCLVFGLVKNNLNKLLKQFLLFLIIFLSEKIKISLRLILYQ